MFIAFFTVWFINSAYSYYWSNQADFDVLKQLIFNAVTVSGGGDAPWLTEDPVTGVVAPDGDTSVVDVTFDAGMVTQPGTYLGTVNIDTSDPLNSSFEVAVTMTVTAPPDWGRLEGIVQSLGYCDANPVPAEGAIVWPSGAVSVTTGEDGSYAIWLEQGTYTVTVMAEDHTSVEVAVEIVPGETTVQDFDLRLLAPCTSVDPESFEVDVVEGYSLTLPLALMNMGDGDTEFKVSEKGSSCA